MSILKKCVAEAIGTAVLVFVACGVAVVSNLGGDAWWIATALAFGFVIVAMAYSIGNISGCHINPAVSFAMALDGRMSWKDFGFYVAAQVGGAIVGALLLGLVLRCNFTNLGGNEISTVLSNSHFELDFGSYVGAFAVEVILTFIFVIAVLGSTDSRYHDGKHAGIVIGLALTLVHLIGLGFTGTSVNPARSIGPALLQAFAGNTTSLQQVWIWILAPMAGGALAAVCYKFLTGKKEEKAAEESNSTDSEAK